MKTSPAADVPEHELLGLQRRGQRRRSEQQAQMSGNSSKRRRSYSIDVKVQAIQMRLDRGMSLKQVSEAFSLPASAGKKMVREWIKDKDKILAAFHAERHIARRVRGRTLPADVEHKIFEWVCEKKRKGEQVLNAHLKEKARELVGDGFRASTGWLVGFKKHYGIEMRQPSLDMNISLPVCSRNMASERGSPGNALESADEHRLDDEEEDDDYESSDYEESDQEFDLSLLESMPLELSAQHNLRLPFPAPADSQPTVVSFPVHIPLSNGSCCANASIAISAATAANVASTSAVTTLETSSSMSNPFGDMTFVSAPVHMSGDAASMLAASNVTVMIPTPTFRMTSSSMMPAAPRFTTMTSASLSTETPSQLSQTQQFQQQQQQLQLPQHQIHQVQSMTCQHDHVVQPANLQTNLAPLQPSQATCPAMAQPVHHNATKSAQQHTSLIPEVAHPPYLGERATRTHSAMHLPVPTVTQASEKMASPAAFDQLSPARIQQRQEHDLLTPNIGTDVDFFDRVALEAFLSPAQAAAPPAARVAVHMHNDHHSQEDSHIFWDSA